MSEVIFHNDSPMQCCGLMEGYGFHTEVQDGYMEAINWRGEKRRISKLRPPNQQDQEDRLTRLISLSSDAQRNCVMIVLADDQKLAKAAAEKLGFKTIQSFWNPNSGNNCHIMTYLHFDSFEDYHDEWGDSGL